MHEKYKNSYKNLMRKYSVINFMINFHELLVKEYCITKNSEVARTLRKLLVSIYSSKKNQKQFELHNFHIYIERCI